MLEAGPKFPPLKCVKWLRRTLSFLGKAALKAAKSVGEMSRTPSRTYGVASIVSHIEECIMVELLSHPGIVDAREFSNGTCKSRQQMKSDHTALEDRMGVSPASTECLRVPSWE